MDKIIQHLRNAAHELSIAISLASKFRGLPMQRLVAVQVERRGTKAMLRICDLIERAGVEVDRG